MSKTTVLSGHRLGGNFDTLLVIRVFAFPQQDLTKAFAKYEPWWAFQVNFPVFFLG